MTRVRTPARRLTAAAAAVLVVAALGAISGGVAAALRGPTWTSESQLLWDPSVRARIDPSYNQPDGQAFDRQVADQQHVVLSDAVVGAVAEASGVSSGLLRDRITVTSTAGSGAFSIAASAPSAVQARLIARATTSAYIAVLRERNDELLQARVTALTAQVTALRRQANAANTTTQNALATTLADLQSQQTAASAARSEVPVEATVQRAAQTPTSPSSLSTPVQAVIGGGLGALLAICGLLLVNAWRRSGPASTEWLLERRVAGGAQERRPEAASDRPRSDGGGTSPLHLPPAVAGAPHEDVIAEAGDAPHEMAPAASSSDGEEPDRPEGEEPDGSGSQQAHDEALRDDRAVHAD